MLPAEPDRRELVVARRGARDSAAELHALAELAAVRRAALVLVPELPDAGQWPGGALERALLALEAIIGAVAR